jgi:hypothetical protein
MCWLGRLTGGAALIGGRLSHWPAIALGQLTFAGDRPELGPRFADLFVFP